jgi:signal transduction histidine kinase
LRADAALAEELGDGGSSLPADAPLEGAAAGDSARADGAAGAGRRRCDRGIGARRQCAGRERELASSASMRARAAERAKAVAADLATATEGRSRSAIKDRILDASGLSRGSLAATGLHPRRMPSMARAPLASPPAHFVEIAAPGRRLSPPRSPPVSPPVSASVSPPPLIRTFESELDPFRFNLLDSGHFVLFRWAWRDGTRFVQGALIQPDAFLSALIGDAFRASALQRAASLHLAWGDRPLGVYERQTGRYERPGAGALPDGTIIYRGRLQEPFGALRLEFEAARLPSPPGAALVYWLGLLLGLVLAAGTLGLYRLGLRQLGLVRQQQAFVAAVSHELKTPLTSIRMYAEMLREGWVTDDKRDRYYRYIQDESERLSRLVTNVLQLARMSHDELRVQPRPLALCELIDLARAGLTSLTAQAGFELVIDCADDALVSADPDALTQVLINLVDNAVKFSAKARVTRIEIGCWVGAEPHAPRRWYQGQSQGAGQGGDAASGQWGWITIRDHGPGIPKAERRRVFELFMTDTTKWVYAFDEGDGKNKAAGRQGRQPLRDDADRPERAARFRDLHRGLPGLHRQPDQALPDGVMDEVRDADGGAGAEDRQGLSATRTSRCWCRCVPARRCPCPA